MRDTRRMLSSQFAIGVAAVVIAVMAAWAWRSSKTPLWARLVLPAAAVGAGCLVPYMNAAMDDEARALTLAEMPQCFAVMALRGAADDKTVDLWVAGRGRIIHLPMDGLKDVLRKAQVALKSGEPAVRICKGKSEKKGQQGLQGVDRGHALGGDSDSKMHIDESLFLKDLKGQTE